MKKIYVLYITAALCTAWLVLFYLGVSAGFANYIPIAALLGSILLFVIAAPLIVYHQRAGLLVGLIGCLSMLPYSFMYIGHLFGGYSGGWRWMLLPIMLPSVFVLVSFYLTVRALLSKINLTPVAINNISKVLLSALPVVLFLLYIAFYGRYWSWEEFKI